ncbi:hypothetical protein [Arthrobacter sp. 754]|uniref:hypothetical protein n=1 Tax=Arthrobacter sp. 754 TaxID=3156315 RepID=UPI00339830A7
MSLNLDVEKVPLESIPAIKRYLHSKGYTAKVILDDVAFERISNLVTGDKRYQLTPLSELRYMEGLLDLPLGYIEEFGFIPSDETRICVCGRVPSALDVVHTALAHGIHSKTLLRDTIYGNENIFEMSSSGREFACLSCGNRHLMAVYHHKRNYMYA